MQAEGMDTLELHLRGLFEESAEAPDLRLGYNGLHELCDKLELQHCCDRLAAMLLLNQENGKRVTFTEFKEALIQILGPNVEPQRLKGDSPSREVSPKYVFGKKKYGRRSRPDCLETETTLVDDVEACSVTEESLFKKRKTEEAGDSHESEEDMLVAAWAAVASHRSKLTRDQLVRVFQGVGLQSGSEEAATSVFEKLEIGDEGITLESLLSFIKGGTALNKSQDFDSIPLIDSTESSSVITGLSLLEQWDAAGVLNSAEILQSLGCRMNSACDLCAITSRLHNLLQNARDDRHSNLFKAGVVLQRIYIHSLKGVVEQMSGENEKLKADVSEANHRSQLLAQEVDDHHTRLEAATARRVKALEQRHAERVRELTELAKTEHDQLTVQNQQLEGRLASLEAEEGQNKMELNRLLVENRHLQDEQQNLVSQLTVLQMERDTLRGNVQELSAIQEKLHELEEMTKDRDVLALMERVSSLESENRCLRDRNDELGLQIEDLTSKLHNATLNKRHSAESGMNLTVDAAIREMESLDMEQDAPNFPNSFEDTENTQGNSLCAMKLKTALAEKLEPLGREVSNAVLHEVDNVLSYDSLQCGCCQLQGTVESLTEDLKKLKEEDSLLRNRCLELETSIEQLQEEYETTENYWTLKLEEERSLFDAEQKQNDQKYSDLVNKIVEYEEMIKDEVAVKQRLETIEENDSLEKQVLQIEEEYTKLLAEKEQEIDRLHQEFRTQPLVVDALAQTDPLTASSESSQHVNCRRSLTFSSGDRRKSCCKIYRLQGEIRNLLETKQAAQREVSALIAERNLLYKQVLSQRREDSCSASLSSKLLCAERKCRNLMATLRNQQLQTAELLRNTWHQHKREVEELRSVLSVTDGKLQQQTIQIQNQYGKMAAADALVKDMFVENAYLLAALRKLEANPGQNLSSP